MSQPAPPDDGRRDRQIQAVIARRDHQIRVVTIAARIIYVACAVCAVLAVVIELLAKP